MSLTRTEINLRRLLAKCELMTKSKQKNDERFPQYIESMEKMLRELVCETSRSISGELLRDYLARIHNIKISVGLLTGGGDNHTEFPSLLDNSTQSISTESRTELLGIRQRTANKTSSTETSGEQLDELIDYHENLQQKIADDMLSLTKNLKEQSQLANKLIKKDTEVVSRSSQLTDANFDKLKVESHKLTQHSKGAWKCWMWLMLAIVLVVFINMVLFMKVMKKK